MSVWVEGQKCVHNAINSCCVVTFGQHVNLKSVCVAGECCADVYRNIVQDDWDQPARQRIIFSCLAAPWRFQVLDVGAAPTLHASEQKAYPSLRCRKQVRQTSVAEGRPCLDCGRWLRKSTLAWLIMYT